MKAPLAILIAILVFALAFSAGCTQQKPPDVNVTQTEPNATQNSSANTTVQAQQCSGGNIVQNDACFAALAKADSDPSYCQNIYSIGTVDSCYAMFANAEFVEAITLSALGSVLFLGGWRGPILPGPLWMLIKMLAILFVFIWIRATLPRLRYDRLMKFGWKVLLPIATLNLVGTAAWVALS